MPPQESSIDSIEIVVSLVNAAKTNTNCVVQMQTRLLEDAGIDSLRLMELIETVQQQCNISLLPHDFSVENFETVNSVVLLVRSRVKP
jgi:acyl carrier protein